MSLKANDKKQEFDDKILEALEEIMGKVERIFGIVEQHNEHIKLLQTFVDKLHDKIIANDNADTKVNTDFNYESS